MRNNIWKIISHAKFKLSDISDILQNSKTSLYLSSKYHLRRISIGLLRAAILPGTSRVGDLSPAARPAGCTKWWVTWSDLPCSSRVGQIPTLQACITTSRRMHA